jgi:hypothetical protein
MKLNNNRPVAEYKGRILSDLEILEFSSPGDRIEMNPVTKKE